MTNRASDTSPECERFQLDLLRKATPAARFARTRSLSQTAIELATRAIRRQTPGMTQTQVDLEFIRLYYGKALSEAVAHYIAERSK